VTVLSGLIHMGNASDPDLKNTSGNNTISGTLGVGNTGISVTSDAGNLTIGTFAVSNNVTVTGAGDVTVNTYTNDGTKYITKTGTGTLKIVNSAGGSARRGLALGAGTLSLTSAGVVTNLAITNTTAGTVIDVDGAVGIGVMNIQAATTIKVDVGTTGQNVSESLTTYNSGGWAVSADAVLKLTPGASFDSSSSATWTILTTQGTFSDADKNHFSVNTNGTFDGVSGTLAVVKSANNKSIQVTYTPSKPTMVTVGAVNISSNAARLKGKMTTAGGTTVTNYGIVYGTSADPTIASGTMLKKADGAPTANQEWYVDKSSGLSPDTTYHYRAYAFYGSGSVAYGDDMTFTTAPLLTLASVEYTYPGSGNTLTLVGGGGGGSGSITYAVASTTGSAAGSISGTNQLSVTACGTVNATGTFTIRVSRAAQGNYAAQSRDFSVTVNKAAQTIGFTTKPLMVTAGKSTDVVATVSSPATGGGAVTYSGNAAAVATVTSGGSVTGVAAGQVTITATAAQTVNYKSATATYTLTVRVAGPNSSGSITSVTSIGADEFTVAFTKGTGEYSVLLAKESEDPSTPVDGTGAGRITTSPVTWTDNTSVYAFPTNSTDGTKVIQQSNGESGSVRVTGATPATEYHLALYSRNPNSYANSAFTNFSYSATPDTRTFWTLSTEPTGNPALVTPTAAAETLGSGSATINWTKGAGANNTLVVIYGPADSEAAAEALAATAPTDGQVYSTGSGLGGTVLHAGAGTTAVASGLTKLKWYKVVGYSYALGGDDSTANYYTPGAIITFQTQDSNGPQVWATGVDGTSYLLNWSPVAGATTGYDVGAGGEIPLLDDGFTTDEGWATASSSTGYKTAASGKWLLASLDITAASSSTDDNKSHAFFPYNVTATLELPPLTGTVTSVSAYLGVPSANDTERGLKLEYYNGSTWTSLGTVSAVFDTAAKTNQVATLTLGAERDVTGQRLRLSRMNGNSVFLFHLWVNGSAATGVKGHDMSFTGLTSGETYTAKVRKNPSGDWSDTLMVTAGVMPGEISADAIRSSVTFTWTDEEDGAVGYKVDATTEEPASATVTYACPTNNGLGTNQWSNGSSWLQWEYTGTVSTESVSSSYITKGPGYVSYDSASKGHYLIGRAGQAVVSTNFDLEGATNAVLAFDNCAWNSANASTTIESSRLDVYYRLDGTNEWNYFATCIATNTGDNKWVSQSMTLPRGALDGDTLAVKIVAPNAEYYNSALRGAGVRNIKLTLQKAAGRYGPGHSLTGYPKTIATPSSHTVTGLDPETKVYFRVQALQGSTNAPTAKSVWVEGEGETSGLVASATAQENGTILVTWTPPTGSGVVILRGRDERHDPEGPLDLDDLPHGYEIVTNATGGAYHANTSPTSPVEQSCVDSEPLGGWKYYYYIYAATDNGDGTITVGAGPSRTATGETPNAVVKGMVNAIASQGWDGWDVHPWGYKKGRVTNPDTDSVQFIDPSQNNGKATWETGSQYTTLYGSTNQLDVYGRTNYYGTNSFRLSGGSCVNSVNSNNPAIQFESIDLSGYKNVEFSMHFAGDVIEGGDDMHVAISTNGGRQWLKVSRTNDALWRVVSTNTYGIVVGDSSPVNDGHWDFYFEDFVNQSYPAWGGGTGWAVPTPEGNPYKLRVPDSVTQFMARVMYYDSQGANRYSSSYFIDEVRLVGEAAMKTPHPTMENISSNSFVVTWDAVPDATSYDVRVASCAATGDDAVKLQQAFVLNVVSDGWIAGDHTSLSSNFNRTASGYGLSLTGNGGTLTSPETGAARSLEFWSKAVSANANSKLQVEVSADGTTWEALTNYTAAASSTATTIGSDDWVKKSVDLPHRQWSRVRFKLVRTSGSEGNFYLDDIRISGGGDYDTCLVKQYTGLTGTSQGFTNGLASVSLSPGTAYYVEVRANGTVGGNPAHSPWGETGDYTSGTVNLRADGFEMVRMWGTASSAVDVLIASSTGDDPIGTPAAGTTYSAGDTLPGGGTVVARWTSNYTENNNFEHVVPANAQVNYAVFWKRGSYYEGRYDTNFWMGKYGSPVADAFAQTNGIAPASFVSSGAGWSAGGTWSAWDDSASHVSIVRGSAYPFGLLGSNQLFGAGGDMIKFDMGTAASELKVRVGRDFATPFAGTETWFMFTVRCQHGADDINKMWGMQLLSETGSDAYKSVIASIGKIKDLTGTTGEAKLSVDTSSDTDGTWLGGGYPLRTAVTDSSYGLKDYGHSGNTNAIYTIVGKYVKSTGKLSVKAYYTPTVSSGSGGVFGPKAAAPSDFDISNVSATANKSITGVTLFGYGWNGNLYFDEIRFGPSWSSLIEEPSPPKPVTAVRAIPDGKELVRLDWTYAASDPDYPDAEGVLVLDKATAWTAEDIAAAKPVNGQPYNVGATIGGATVAYLGEAGWTVSGVNYQDLVVEPGSTHYYRVYAHSSYMYTNGVAASGTAPSQYPVTMETYRTGEHVVPFSYTNASTAVTNWQGGAGFTGGWTGTGTWTAMLPLEQPGSNPSSDPVLADVTGYPARAGNAVMVTDPGNGGTATLTRALDTAVTASQTNFYAAFMMAYEWKGSNKWAGVSILNGSDQEIGFAGKGSGANWNTLAVASDLTAHWSQTDLLPYDPGNADSSGALDHAYLVVMRYNFANRTLSALAVPCGGEMPEYEPTQWDVSWQVRDGLGSSVAKIQLNVGSSDPGGTIGYCWFDELRWGTRWDDIVSGKCADSIPGAWWRKENSTENLEETYLGNSGTFLIRSTPTGFGQEAWLTIDWTGGASAHTVTTNQLAWLTNETVSGVTYTWWSNKVQLVEVGEVGGVNASADWPATAKVTALNADCVAVSETTRLTVTPLGAPTGVTAAKDAVKTNSVINVSWTPWQGTLTGVDVHTKDVLVVRFSGATEAAALAKAALAANQPVQGRAYSAGDSIGEGTVVWRGGDEGRVTTAAARGLQPQTCYAFAVYTENYSYYSAAAYATATTDEGGHDITVDGDPTDWYGEAPDTLNTAWVNLGEFIWKDKTGEERHSAGSGDSTVANPSSDIDEFRIYADANWVYFLVKMTNITDVAKPYVAVGVDSRKKASSEEMNWLGDESATTIGSNYWANTANEHYPRWQLNVHQVTGQGTQVEQYAADGSEWYAPVGTVTTTEGETSVTRGWAAAIASGEGMAVEFRVARSDIGLAGIGDGETVTQRFTVASFVNTGVWNNQGGATAEIYGGTSKAVDALGIAPQRPASKPDNDYLLSSWDEDIADGNIDFWVDVAFSKSGVVENQRPSAPSQLVFPTADARLKSSPTFEWKRGSDTDGKVTGYMLEVSTNADFHDLNGTVTLRVNVPALVTGETDSTKYHYAWSGAHQQTMYYWRVRSRDTGGMLSTPASGQFWVDEDGDGPVATLKYVGTDVAGYMAGNYAQQEKLWPESLLSVTDAEIERVVNDPSLKFGFVIEWNDPNGVYATNHLHDGAGANKGKWAWNIASGDGRVSPNWDLVEFHTTLTDRSADTNSFAGLVTDVTGHGEWTTNYWDETGCWGYQWGYDEAFSVGTAGTAADQTRGANGDTNIINLVRSAFDMHAFDTNVDYYLTVSAEDCTTWKESGYDWWEYGTWKSFKDPSDPDAPGSRYSSGWCADGPNRARNVTTNQLLEIRVRDNDVTAPGASLNRWSTTSFIASTNDATPNFANPEKQLTRESGTGLPTFVTTDGELAGRPLALHFNVYDSSMTGIKLGTAETETVAGLVGSHTMTNSWLVRTQQVGDSEPDVMTNRANYVAAKSTLESSGTGAGTVLTWYWPTMDAENIAHFWATNAVDEGGVLTETVNTLALNLWDLDNNRDGDQMGAETVMGYLKVRDDDTSAPVARDMHTLGTGTNRVVFGLLARWPMATNEATDGRKCTTINEMLTGAAVSNGFSGSGHGTLTFYPSYSMWGYTGIRLTNPQRAVQFPLTAGDNAQWESEALSFKFRTTHGGPTNLTVTVSNLVAGERTLGTIHVEKDLDDNGDHADTTTDVTVLFAGADKVTCLAGQTATFRVYADGLETDSSAAQFGEFKVYGVVSLPPGTEVTDQDMRTATWTNSVDVSDGAQGKTDTLRSGLWLTHSAAYTGAAADEPVPKYVLEDASTHEAITNGLVVSGLTAAFENEVDDGDFETDFTSPGSEWSLGGGALHVTDATGGNHVLKFTANGASATKVLDLGDVTGATAIRAKCDQVEYKGGRVRLTYVWLDENGDEVEAESAAHSTANNGWEIWVPRNQSVSAANLEAGTVRQLEVTFTREDSSNEADLDDILVYAEVVTAGGTRTVPATPADDDFESETSGWELSDGASVELGGAIRTGSYAVEVSATTDVVQNWVAVEAAEGLLQGSMLGSVWTRGAAAAVEVRFFKTQAVTTPLTDWLTVNVPATVDWARTEIPATIAELSETGLTTVYGLVRVRGGGSGATFVDDLEMIVVGWGSPTAGATVENGTKSAALQFTTANLVDDSGKLSLPGGVAVLPKDYNFGVQVADYDLDRTQDHLVTTSGGSFRLYDDDATAPQAGMMFGGSLGVRTGDAKAPYAGLGTDVDVRLSDGAMVAAGSSAQVAFDLDFYDFSGWDTLGLSWYPAEGGAHTLVWTNGSGSMASAVKTKGNGEANSPSATNTVTVPVSTLWGLSAVQDAFRTGIVSNWMAATITDKDADRAGDELVWTNKVGMLTFLDDDVKAPKLGSINRWPRQMFVGKGSVSALAAATNNYEDYRRSWPRGTEYEDDVPVHERTTVVYDGELRALATENLFIEVDMNDPSDSMKGRSATGLRRGTDRTVAGQSNGLGDTYTTTNTWLGLFAESGTDASSYASATPVIDATGKYSSADSTAEDHTKGSLGVMWNVWKWTANLTTNAVATPDPEAVVTWLPSGSDDRALRAVVHAYDADTDRPGDQLESVIVGQVIRVRDDDTVPPEAVGDIMNNGVNITYTGSTLPSRTDPSVKWTNNLSSMTLTFTAATDGAKGADDLNVSGIGGYRLAAATPAAATDGTALEYTLSAGTVTAELGDSDVTQGLTAEYVFAVDADDDRPGDALAGPAKGFVLAYDITPPTKIGSAASPLVASTDSVDDPTTQFDLTWPTGGAVGPDDDGSDEYDLIPERFQNGKDSLSPWYSYKIYYTNYDVTKVPSDDDPVSDTKSYIYTHFIQTTAYTNWAYVMTNSPTTDPTAPKEAGTGRPTAYDSLGVVSNSAANQRIRLYDLDFDQEYAVIIVGVDKAGNEGPAGLYSWATNNTIKFAVTQGVVRARAAINDAVGALVSGKSTNTVGMAKMSEAEGAPTKGAVLRWMTGAADNPKPVTKYYDLIYRDAPSFTEDGAARWEMAATADNSGTSMTNWNYQADDFGGLGRGRLRFYRASYKGRWNPSDGGRPLASEEVYSMNRVPLVEGRNLVALQGVPYTNTFAGVFGTDTNVFPAGAKPGENATRVEFFADAGGGQDVANGETLVAKQSYYFLQDTANHCGYWAASSALDTPVDNVEQDPQFFSRGFMVYIPDLAQKSGGEYFFPADFRARKNGSYSNDVPKSTATGGKYWNWEYGFDWYPILKVPSTNDTMVGYTAVTAESGNPKAEGWYERGGTVWGYTYTLSADTAKQTGKTYYATGMVQRTFSVTVKGGIHSADGSGARYTLVSLNLPVAAHPKDMNLIQTNASGAWTNGFHPGNGHRYGDVIYLWDNERGTVRDDRVVYYDDKAQAWGMKPGGINADALNGYFKPNDVIMIMSYGPQSAGSYNDWIWTYGPEQFYQSPTRWMGWQEPELEPEPEEGGGGGE
jgi:hypothetical protein